MSVFDHPAQNAAAVSARDAVVAAADRLADQLRDATSVRALVDAENDLVAAVDAWRHLTVGGGLTGQWRGPGVYAVTVADDDGAMCGSGACRTLDELVGLAASMIPPAAVPLSVLAVWDGPILGSAG